MAGPGSLLEPTIPVRLGGRPHTCRVLLVWHAAGAVESGGRTLQHLGRAQRAVSTGQVPTAAHRQTSLRRHSHKG